MAITRTVMVVVVLVCLFSFIDGQPKKKKAKPPKKRVAAVVKDLEKNVTALWGKVDMLSQPVHVHLHGDSHLMDPHHHDHHDHGYDVHHHDHPCHRHHDEHNSSKEKDSKEDQENDNSEEEDISPGPNRVRPAPPGFQGDSPLSPMKKKRKMERRMGMGMMRRGHGRRGGHDDDDDDNDPKRGHHSQGGKRGRKERKRVHKHHPGDDGQHGDRHGHGHDNGQDHEHGHGHGHERHGHEPHEHGHERHGHEPHEHGHERHGHEPHDHGHEHHGLCPWHDEEHHDHNDHGHHHKHNHPKGDKHDHHHDDDDEHEGMQRGTHVHIHLHTDGMGDMGHYDDDDLFDHHDDSEYFEHDDDHDMPPDLPKEYLHAVCEVVANSEIPSARTIQGSINMRQMRGEPLELKVKIRGFPIDNRVNESVRYLRGMHGHVYGDTSDNCKRQGGHYNPHGIHHGGPSAHDRHPGDFGNLVLQSDGAVDTAFNDTHACLFGHHSLLGRGIVIIFTIPVVSVRSLLSLSLYRWAEHFNNVLNCPSTINNQAIDRLPQVPVNEALDAPPSLEETRKSIHPLSSGNAPGSDSIPAEVYKEGGVALAEKLHQLFQLIHAGADDLGLGEDEGSQLSGNAGNRIACCVVIASPQPANVWP
ncbi:hypothetical protein ACOMHN_018249 [Nucella lapillus]